MMMMTMDQIITITTAIMMAHASYHLHDAAVELLYRLILYMTCFNPSPP